MITGSVEAAAPTAAAGRPTGAPSSTCRGWGPMACTTSPSGSGRARSWGSPGCSAPGGRPCSRRCSGPAGSTTGRVGLGGAPLDLRSPTRAMAAGVALGPRATVAGRLRRPVGGREPEPGRDRAVLDRPPPRPAGRAAGRHRRRRRVRHRGGLARRRDGHAQRRQPAEGRPGPVAAPRPPPAPARRAHPRRRRRGPGRDPHHDPAVRHGVPGHHPRVLRRRGAVRPGRPGPGPPGRAGGPRGRGGRRPPPTPSTNSSTRGRRHDRGPTPPDRRDRRPPRALRPPAGPRRRHRHLLPGPRHPGRLPDHRQPEVRPEQPGRPRAGRAGGDDPPDRQRVRPLGRQRGRPLLGGRRRGDDPLRPAAGWLAVAARRRSSAPRWAWPPACSWPGPGSARWWPPSACPA